MAERNYKFDILEKLSECYCLFYFVFGIFTSYTWACKELDLITEPRILGEFWEPIALSFGILNIFNVILLSICHFYNKRNINSFIFLTNESSVLFYFLCIPLFIVTIIYMILEAIWQIYSLEIVSGESVFCTVTEMLMYCGIVMLIIEQNRFSIVRNSNTVLTFNNLVTLISIVGMMEFFIYHMTSQQIHNFIKVSSNYSNYSKYFSKDLLTNRSNNFIHHEELREYVQPLVILFCCSCLAYLITIFYRNTADPLDLDNTVYSKKHASEEHLVSVNSNPSYESIVDDFVTNEPNIELNNQIEDQLIIHTPNTEPKKQFFPSFRLPPMSLVMGILLITLCILLLAITGSFLSSSSVDIRRIGMIIFTYFPVPVYLISLLFMFMQIKEMKRWEKMKDFSSIVDKTLIWIGASGQIIVALGQIKFFISCNDEKSIMTAVVVEYVFLIIQTMLQTVTLSLALDRKWIPPIMREWQEYICPSVCLLSVNIGFFIFSLVAVDDAYNQYKTCFHSKDYLYLKMFGNGFHTLGETLAILHRLHSALVFGRMVVYTNT